MASSFVNPKHSIVMNFLMERICHGVFDEFDIRSLLIGIRAFSNEISNQGATFQSSPGALKFGFKYLNDIADSIAHPEMKNQGPIRAYIKNTDNAMAKALSKMHSHKVLEVDEVNKKIRLAMPSSIKSLKMYDLVIAFVCGLEWVLGDSVKFDRLLKHAGDIELCLMAIMHLVQFPYLDDDDLPNSRCGYMSLQEREGRIHLYAGVVFSNYGKVLANGRIERDDFISTFPVFESSSSSVLAIKIDAKNPGILFALRDSNGALVLTPM